MSKYDCELNLKDRNSLSVLLTRVKPNSTILEFGPANGRMTRYMKEQLNCKVYAIEIDQDSAKDAEKYTEKMIVDSIENYTWKEELKNIKFDYIIFADVLEHLYFPEKVLDSVRDFLKDDGSILVSIPNIAHNSIIINLLKNEFNYNSIGLLDNTHIKFFTKKTFDALITEMGYFISYETAIFLNPENTEFKNSYEDLIPSISEYLQSLSYGEIYQLIYEIKKEKVEIISDYLSEYKMYNKYFLQLFISKNMSFTEENSIKLPVSETNEIQCFELNVSDFGNIKNLRFDPLNDSCVVDIEKLYLELMDGTEINLIPYINSNICSINDKSYFFEFFDPQIYFENIDLQMYHIIKLHAKLSYKHISKDAVHICANEIAKDKNNIIMTLENELRTKEQNIQKLNEELNLKNEELKAKEENIENLKVELVNIYLSRSWKITRPLRIVIKNLKRIIKV